MNLDLEVTGSCETRNLNSRFMQTKNSVIRAHAKLEIEFLGSCKSRNGVTVFMQPQNFESWVHVNPEN